AHKNGEKYADFAVLYRTNAQSRIIEELLMRSGIPYKVLGGLRFYDRKEIKDIIAYLRLIHNVNDSLSFERIVNEPKRGIGKTTVDKVSQMASASDVSSFEIAKNANSYSELSRQAAGLIEFCAMILSLKKAERTMRLTEFAEKVLNDTGYMPALMIENSVEAKTRIDNLGEFLSAVSEYEKTEETPSLAGFLESVSLVSDIDAYDENDDTCVLMTIHSAKGLEFQNVFLSGMEEGLFPSVRSLDSSEDLEEERRLCYVAITRAKRQLYVTAAKSRTVYGQTTHQVNSRFLKEIPDEYLIEDGAAPIDRLGDSIQIPQSVKRAKAEMLGKISSASSFSAPKIDFSAGDRVRHKLFGEGTVTAVQRFEKDALLEVKFDSGEVKRLMAAFAKLEKI
ncbi:MAG: ATP-binding domain-containing protein, partial [Clostridia bacterium]|nr:ATP-binding domain-containing protein [Clostridia bacterium]